MPTTYFIDPATLDRVLTIDNAEVRSAEGKGQGLFATKDIKEDDTIMVLAPPAMMAIDQGALPNTCYC